MKRGQASSFHLRQFLEGPREGAMRTALSFSQWLPFPSGVLQRLQAGTLERRKGLLYHLVRFYILISLEWGRFREPDPLFQGGKAKQRNPLNKGTLCPPPKTSVLILQTLIFLIFQIHSDEQ